MLDKELMMNQETAFDRVQSTTKRLHKILEELQQNPSVDYNEKVQLAIGFTEAVIRSQRDIERAAAHMLSLVYHMPELEQLATIAPNNPLLALDEILDALIRISGAERASLFLGDKPEELQLASIRYKENSLLKDQEFVYSHGALNRLAKMGDIVIIQDAREEDNLKSNSSVREGMLRFILCGRLMARGHTIGVIYADNPSSPIALDRHLVPLLKILINQMAIALDNVSLFDEVKRQKYRIVHEREEERKRISDMLHDVLGAKLGMMKRNAEHAETLVATNPDEAIRLMQQQQDDLQQMAIVTRNLSYELLPPTIRLGLDEALQAYIGQIQGIKIDFPLSKLPKLPLAVKTAAYYIAVQALENVQNHAGARKCRLELWIEEKSNSLCLQIEDDGKGLPNNLRWGVGLVSMYERTSELNGELLIRNRTDQSGTLVLATLPLHYAN